MAWLGVDLREEEVEVEPDGADESKSSAVDAFAFRSERAVVVVSEYACSAPTVLAAPAAASRASGSGMGPSMAQRLSSYLLLMKLSILWSGGM